MFLNLKDKTMQWVIQDNIANEERTSALIQNIDRFGQKVHLVKVVPFVGEIMPDLDFDDEKVICFGSYSMRHQANKKGWFPGVYDMEWFPYQSLIEVLGNRVLNDESVFGEFGEINPEYEEFFIRPTHDGKEFAGTIKSKGQLKEWQAKVIKLGRDDFSGVLRAQTEVMCSPLKKIYDEFRYFVVDGKVVTGSQYKLGKRVVYGDTDYNIPVAQEFVDVLNDHISHPFVIDIALTDDGYKVIELNTLNCAGFYAADMQKLVAALIKYECG
jgi:hypothetical protein